MRKISYILLAVLPLLTSCKKEKEDLAVPEAGKEIRSVQAEVSSGMITRAPQPTTNVDYIGRDKFVTNDVMVLTHVHRTTKPLTDFSYTNVHYTSNSNRAWTRDVDTINHVFDAHDRIFWSDNKNGHTFIGYSVPQAWNDLNTKWNNVDGEYSGQFSYAEVDGKKIVDFTIIHPDSLKDEMKKDANGVLQPTGNKVDSVGHKLKNEDLLLTYNTEQKADATGLNTVIYYRHALASLRVIIDIQGFSPSSTAQDTKTTVHDLVVKNQPWKYKWTQAPQAGAHGINIPGWGVSNNTEDTDGTVDIQAWQPRPSGEGTGQAKKFTFYSLIVPGQQENLTLDFKVTYPMYLNPADTQTKDYHTTIDNIDFLPGYTTTILLSLNHEGEPIYLGAEYIDWENVEIPDNSELQKISIFLDTNTTTDASGKTIVSIANDQVATKDDATWLYYPNGDKTTYSNVLDIYGHDGTQADPFIIKTARQLLSFAYEVKSGRSFAGQYIKLDSDIYLQKSTSDSTIIWPGIGDATNKFEGYFNGGFRHIRRLNGASFFNTIGPDAIVDHLFITDAIEITGTGSIAEINNGIICGCNIEGDIIAQDAGAQYTGSILGQNNGVLIACSHVGKTVGYGTVGVLLGYNNGIVAMCYNCGDASTKSPGQQTYAGIGVYTDRSIAYCCYFNQDLYTGQDYGDLSSRIGHVAVPLNTNQMQSDPFVNLPSVEDADGNVTGGEIYDDRMPKSDPFFYHLSLNEGIRRAVQLLTAVRDDSSARDVDGNYLFHNNPPTGFDPMPLKPTQVQWLIDHFANNSHKFQYVPSTYPKLQ